MRFNHITQRNIVLAKKLFKIPRFHIKAAEKIMLCRGRSLIMECLIDSIQQNLVSGESHGS